MHYRSIYTLRNCLLGVLLISSFNVIAQQEWQSRNSISVAASLDDNISIKVNHLRAYEITDHFKSTFYQTGFQVRYDLNKRWDLFGGVQFLTSASSKETRNRLYIRAAHTTRISKKLNWTNSIRLETNSKNQTRFRQRIGLYTRLGLRKRLDFLNLSPSVTYSMFYNIGGGTIRYYDKNEQLIARQSPDGFHRGRLTVNLNSKVNKYLSIGLYYMRQQEFNFLTPDTRKMNVYDPVRDRTLRSFKNFNALGLSAQFNLNPFLNK